MPDSLIAAAVLVTLFLPGYLFQAGVKQRTVILTAERDIYAIGQAVAISVLLLVVAFLVLSLFSGVQHDLLQDPSRGSDRGLNLAQSLFLLGAVLLPLPLGIAVGRVIARARRSAWEESDGGAHKLLGAIRFLATSGTISEELKGIVRDAEQGQSVYVRLVSQGSDDVIGLVDREAAIASVSPLGDGLAVSSRWVQDVEHGVQRLGPAHVSKTGLIKVLSWRTGDEHRPPWVEDWMLDAAAP